MGERNTRDIPVGLPFDIGNPYDVQVSSRTAAVSARGITVKSQHLKEGKRQFRRDTIEVTATDHKSVPAAFEWCQTVYDSTRLVSEERKHVTIDGCWVWQLALKPGGQTRFHYKAEEMD